MQNSYDLIIVGGGAAGMMAAISAKRSHGNNFNVAIIDRTFALGRKILVCGAGRCNITNINLDKSIDKHYYGSTNEFIHSIFSQFSYKDIINFFNDLGIEVYVERKTDIGKLFPITDQAKTVTTLLEDELERLGVDIYLNTDVISIISSKNKEDVVNETREFKIDASLIDNENKVLEKLEFNSKYLILSAGGRTYPALGSNGSGYSLAESLGHNIIHPVPSALPLVSKNPLSHALQGVKLELEVTSILEGKEIKTRTDDVMFTQYGVSGPAILNISREISILINRKNKKDAKIKINFFPGKSKEDVSKLFNTRWNKRPDQTIEKSMFGLFPNKVPAALLNVLKINKDKRVKDLNNLEKDEIFGKLTSFIIKIDGTRGWNEAEFSAGGIDTKDVKEKTLESKIIENLYFCGEILDVDGDVGGFNLSWAWSSGNVAGRLI